MTNPFLAKSYKWNRPKKHDNPEGIVQLQILHYLKALGAVAGKTRTMGVKRGKIYCLDPYTMLGKADLECFYKGVMFAIECKSATGKMSDNQKSYHEVFHKPPDRIYILARNLSDVQEIIK